MICGSDMFWSLGQTSESVVVVCGIFPTTYGGYMTNMGCIWVI